MAEPYPPRRSSSSRKLLKDIPTQAQIADALRNLKDASDFTLAVTGGAYLQYMTELLLKSRLIKLNKEDERRMFDAGQNGFLSSFSSQIRLCFALGLLPISIYEDLLLMNDIRNTFAHSMHKVDFKSKEIIQDCERINYKLSGGEPSERVKAHPAFFIFHNAVLIYAISLRAISVGMKVTNIEELQAASQHFFAGSS